MAKMKKCVVKSILDFLDPQGSELRSQNTDPIQGIRNFNANKLLWDRIVSSGGPAILGHQRML